MERAITVDIESSSREEDVSITSNLSSIDSFYTMVQGTDLKTVFLRYEQLQSDVLEGNFRGIVFGGRGDTHVFIHI